MLVNGIQSSSKSDRIPPLSKSGPENQPSKEGFVSQSTVLLADDNLTVLGHVRKMLEKEKAYKVVAAMADGTAVIREYFKLKPDVLILDISMGDVSGIDIARQLRDQGCRSKIVFLSIHEDREYVNAAIGAGGSAYVVKSRLNLDLLSALKAVLSNKLFVSANLMYEPS
jgi:DNA-binding NarL/FixJ family response regulator